MNDAYLCDRCNRDIANGDLTHCVIVNRAIPATGSVIALQFCVETCAAALLTDENLAAYLSR